MTLREAILRSNGGVLRGPISTSSKHNSAAIAKRSSRYPKVVGESPFAASARICLSSVRSETARRGRLFSVYGARWGRWIKSNVERDLRSGALRVNASGETIH